MTGTITESRHVEVLGVETEEAECRGEKVPLNLRKLCISAGVLYGITTLVLYGSHFN